MTDQELRAVILESLRSVAPEVDAADVPAAEDLREALDLDSFDYLSFLVAIHQRLGVDIPESDYGKLTTLDELVSYLASRVAR